MPQFLVEKDVRIQADPRVLFQYLRDFKKWPRWSPWLIAEPGCSVKFSTDGRSYEWEGNIVGSGRMEVLAEKVGESIDYQLDFLKPWKSRNQVRFQLDLDGGATRVTWSMVGTLPLFLFWMKGMMSAFVGMDYQRGLDMLKDDVEIGSVPSRLEFPGKSHVPGCHYLGVRGQENLRDIGEVLKSDMKKLSQAISGMGTQPSAPPFVIYHKFRPAQQTVHFTLGIPLSELPATAPQGMVLGTRAACEAYGVRHTGAYRHLGNAWAAGMLHGRAKSYRKASQDAFEVYENDPSQLPEKDWVTMVHFPTR